MSGRTFTAEIWTPNRIIRWPFGRLDVSSTEIVVRAWPGTRFQPRVVARDNIDYVMAERMWNVIVITFKSSGESLADVKVIPSMGHRRVMAELKDCGYTVDMQLDSIWKKARMSIKKRLFR
jgi:hypothetical protein